MVGTISCSGRVLLIVIAAALLIPAPFSTSSATQWEPMNGPHGGGIVGLGRDTDGSVYAAREDNIFRTDDGGQSWVNVSNGAVRADILCLHVTPSGDLFAGVFSRGVYWSYDGGETWDNDQLTNDPHGGQGSTILGVGVSQSDVIFAGSFRSLNGGASWLEMESYGNAWAFDSADNVYAGTGHGVRISDDQGGTWTDINTGMEDKRVIALALNSQNHIYAGTWYDGLFVSIDGGSSWTSINDGLPSLAIEAIAIDAADRVYVTLYEGGLFLSSDSGMTWEPIDDDMDGRRVLSLLSGPWNIVYAGSEYHGVFSSTDQGGNWLSLATADMRMPFLTDFAISPATGDMYGAADGGGIHRSTNGGVDWEARSDGLPTTRTHAVACDASGRVYAGTEEGLYASTDDGATWFAANAGYEDIPALGILIDGEDNVIAVLAHSEFFFEFWVVRSTDGGLSWQEILSDQDATFPTTAEAYAIDVDDRLFIAGMSIATEGVIFISDDDGTTWDEVTFPAGLGTTSLAVDSNGVVYAPLGNNDLYTSTDHGATWTEIPNGGWPTGTVGVLDAVAVDENDAVLLSSRRSGIWRSVDGGETWSGFDEGLPSDNYPSVTFIEAADDALFAGTLSSGLHRRGNAATNVDATGIPTTLTPMSVSPNPASAGTGIGFSLSEGRSISITIHDVAGRLVRDLVREEYREAGRHIVMWDGRDDSQRSIPTGVYFVRLDAAGRRENTRLILTR